MNEPSVWQDARLANGGAPVLASFLARAFPTEEDVRRLLTWVELQEGSVLSSRGTVLDHWNEVLIAVDRGQKVNKLLNHLAQELKNTPGFLTELQTWQARGARRASLEEAVVDVGRISAQLRTHADPRTASTLLPRLHSALLDIRERMLDREITEPLFDALPDQDAARSRKAIISAARRTQSAVDHLSTALGLADAGVDGRRRNEDDITVFRRENAITDELLDSRDRVDEQALMLLDLLGEVLPHAVSRGYRTPADEVPGTDGHAR